MTELWKATEPGWKGLLQTMHIIALGENFADRYIVCCNFDGETWDCGTYFTTLEKAIRRFQANLDSLGWLPYVELEENQND
jgi:uncharacterized cysteine cluster protein YcgN (CxxCxxCC family)